MKNFYLTFGVQYPEQQHPYWSAATHAGWVRIIAESEDTARMIAQQFFGKAWSLVYPEAYFDTSPSRKFYPEGELLVIKQKDRTQVKDVIDNNRGYIASEDVVGTFTTPSEDKVYFN